MPSRLYSLVMLLTCSTLAFGQTAKKPSAPSTRMSDGLVTAALNAWNGASTHFTGLHHADGDTTRLSVFSGRQLIAFESAQAVGTGARYTPPPAMRIDTVRVECGDSDMGEIFNCIRVALRVGGKAIKPIQYRPETNTYSNALGAKWAVREVVAVYLVTGLEGGFSIDYASPNGLEWTFDVSAQDAEKELLLTLKR